jgi:hypothetical protein
MLDNLRNQALFQEEEEPTDHKPPQQPKPPKSPKPRKPRKPRKPGRSIDQVTGMTAPQRFALVLMLFFIVCLFGSMLLLVSGKVVLPFIP